VSEETCPAAFSFEQRVQLGVDVLPEFVFRGDTCFISKNGFSEDKSWHTSLGQATNPHEA